MDYLLVFGWMILSFLLVILVMQGLKREVRKCANKEISRLKSRYPGIFDGGYKFYTNGHPYVWDEVSLYDAIKLIELSVTGAHGVPIDPPVYSIKIDEDKKNIYIVPHKVAYDFSKLKHYQEWLDSQREAAKNIAKYKNSQ
ncbi:hypothetical protein TDB9533_03907 [Thalassocella blandensis]|nr:hypothetical protein TDB9533_03907 [Thalassocella blandensis]